MNTMNPKSPKPSVSLTSKIASLAGVVVSAVVVTLLLHYHDIHGSNSPKQAAANTANQLKAADNSRWQTYTSAEDKFKVQFPGRPTVKKDTQSVANVSIARSTYELEQSDGYWAVGVYRYPPEIDMSDTRSRLEGALNGAVQNTPGATLASKDYITLDGRPAISGVLHAQHNGETVNEYIVATLSGNTMYTLLNVNGSSSDFKTFKNSFHLQ